MTMMLEDWHERAATMQYDAGMSREAAEMLAWRDVMGEGMPWFIGQVVWAMSPADDAAIAAAKEWIREQGLSADAVSLRKSENCVYVLTRAEVQ